MSSHLGLDALADLLVGEGDEQQVAHLAGCPSCSARLAELDEAQPAVDAALQSLPVEAEPIGLAGRVADALRAEPPPRAVPRADAGPLPLPEAEDPDRDSRDGPRLTKGEPPAPPPARDSSTGDLVAARARRAGAGSPWLLKAAAGVVAVLALAVGGVLLLRPGGGATTSSTASSSRAEAPASTASGVPTSSSGVDYESYTSDRAALQRALPGLLAGRPAAAPGQPQSAATAGVAADPLAGLRDPAGLAGCLSALARPGQDGTPLALDYASYAGAPALAVVLPAPAADRVDVFVVGPDCGPGRDSTLYSVELARG